MPLWKVCIVFFAFERKLSFQMSTKESQEPKQDNKFLNEADNGEAVPLIKPPYSPNTHAQLHAHTESFRRTNSLSIFW